jgi:hypothetical protein
MDNSSSTEIEALDPAYVVQTLSNPPFVTIAGVYNVRDIGSLPLSSDVSMVTRPRFAYRAAEISAIQDSGARTVLQRAPYFVDAPLFIPRH